MRIDWFNVLRSFAQFAVIAIGAVLPLLTAEWWTSIGFDPGIASPLLAAAVAAVAAAWRQKYQHAFEPKDPTL